MCGVGKVLSFVAKAWVCSSSMSGLPEYTRHQHFNKALNVLLLHGTPSDC